jgi:hypothetical protein
MVDGAPARSPNPNDRHLSPLRHSREGGNPERHTQSRHLLPQSNVAIGFPPTRERRNRRRQSPDQSNPSIPPKHPKRPAQTPQHKPRRPGHEDPQQRPQIALRPTVQRPAIAHGKANAANEATTPQRSLHVALLHCSPRRQGIVRRGRLADVGIAKTVTVIPLVWVGC